MARATETDAAESSVQRHDPQLEIEMLASDAVPIPLEPDTSLSPDGWVGLLPSPTAFPEAKLACGPNGVFASTDAYGRFVLWSFEGDHNVVSLGGLEGWIRPVSVSLFKDGETVPGFLVSNSHGEGVVIPAPAPDTIHEASAIPLCEPLLGSPIGAVDDGVIFVERDRTVRGSIRVGADCASIEVDEVPGPGGWSHRGWDERPESGQVVVTGDGALGMAWHAYDAAAVSVGGSPWSRPRSGRPHLFGDLLVLPDGRDLLLQTSGSVTVDSGGESFELQTPWEGYEDRECGDPFPLAAALAGEDGDLFVLFGLEGRLIVTPTAALPRTEWSEVASASLVQDPYQTYSDMCCAGDRCAVVDPALGVAWADVRSPGSGWRRLHAPSILPPGWNSVESMAVSGGDLWVRTGPTLGSISPTGVYRAVMGASPRGGGGSAGRQSCSFGFPYPLEPASPGLVGLSVFDVVALGEDRVEVLAEIDPGLRAALGFRSPEVDVVGRDVLVLVVHGAAATYPLSTWRGKTGWRSASAGDLSEYNFVSGLSPPDTIACGSDGRCFAPAWGPRGAIEAEDWASVRFVLLESPEGGPLAGPWTPVSGVEGVAGVRVLREGEPVAMGPCSIWLRDAGGGGWKGTDVRGGPCAELPPWSTCLQAAEDGEVAEACRAAEWPEMTWAVACGTKVVVRFLRDSGFWVVDPDAGDTSASMSLPRIEEVDEMASWAGGVAVLSAGTLVWYSCEGI